MNASSHRIEACVVAAGTSSRFGGPKLVQQFHGRPLLQHALGAAAKACPDNVTLILGHERKRIQQVAEGHFDRVVVNERYAEGLGSSIAAAAAGNPSATAKIIMLADQPLVTASDLEQLIETWSGRDDEIVTARFAGGSGPPTLFPQQAFSALRRLEGDRGAKKLIHDGGFRVRYIDIDAAKFDIDTPDDLRRLEEYADTLNSPD